MNLPSKTFGDNKQAFAFACDLNKFMDTSSGIRVAIIEEIGSRDDRGRSLLNLSVEATKPITGYAEIDNAVASSLHEGDLVGVQVVKILKLKAGMFRKYDLAVCHLVALLEPTFDFAQGWKVKRSISGILDLDDLSTYLQAKVNERKDS